MKYKDNDKGNAKDNGKDNDKDHDKDKDKDNDKGNEKYKDNDKGTLFQLHPGVTACHQQDLDQGESTFAVCVINTSVNTAVLFSGGHKNRILYSKFILIAES